MRRHEECAQRHEAAAALWDTGHQSQRAEFERRCARIEREAAQLDADRAEFGRLRASEPARPDAAVRAQMDRLAEAIERRSARLRAGDAALEQERVRLWPHHAARERGRAGRAANLPNRPNAFAVEAEREDSRATDDPFGASRRAQTQTRENARRLSSVLSRTADVLETSAGLAQANAERLEGLGRPEAGAEERRVADRGYEAARRARLHATEWLEFALGRVP
jgi:hypothetical protein